MKTAMQQLIDFLEPEMEMGDFSQLPAYEKAKQLIEAEKEQIHNAYSAGAMDACYDFDDIDAKEYYNVTFKSDQ